MAHPRRQARAAAALVRAGLPINEISALRERHRGAGPFAEFNAGVRAPWDDSPFSHPGGDRRSGFLFSITVYPRWISLFFTPGASLAGPHKLLKGSGTAIRHIVLEAASTLDATGVRALMAEALKRAVKPLDASAPRGLVIKSVSQKQRPRRPGA